MKKILLSLLVISILLLACARFRTMKTASHVEFSLPLDKNGVKVIQSSDHFFEIPSQYFIKDRFLYLVDLYNFRIIKVKRKGDIQLSFGEENKNPVSYDYVLKSSNFSGLKLNDDIFKFIQPNQILVDSKDNILVENVLSSTTEEHEYNAYSLILQYDKTGAPVFVYGRKINSGYIFPFQELDHFAFDRNDHLFVFEKSEYEWKIYKFSQPDRIESFLASSSFITNVPSEEKEQVKIEGIDNSYSGDFLVAAINFYRENFEYLRTEFYRISLEGQLTRLFTVKDEEYSFIILDHSDIIYMWRTVERSREDYILLRLFSLKGRIIINKMITMDRDRGKWFDIRIHKNNKISGINLNNNLFNIMVWE
ncbi:MAG: hypothetical protein JW827_08225 [Spirochaetes bacterium]|nr:hypothetical protein [Spirochaetota bacterium]